MSMYVYIVIGIYKYKVANCPRGSCHLNTLAIARGEFQQAKLRKSSASSSSADSAAHTLRTECVFSCVCACVRASSLAWSGVIQEVDNNNTQQTGQRDLEQESHYRMLLSYAVHYS